MTARSGRSTGWWVGGLDGGFVKAMVLGELQQMCGLSKTRLESGARIEQELRVGKKIA